MNEINKAAGQIFRFADILNCKEFYMKEYNGVAQLVARNVEKCKPAGLPNSGIRKHVGKT